MLRQMEDHFPGLYDYLEGGLGYVGVATTLHLGLNSPITYSAAGYQQPVGSGTCSQCKTSWRIVVFNFRLAVWLGHLLGAAHGTGLSKKALRRLGSDLQQPSWNPDAYRPATSPYGLLLWSGICWLVAHEYAHRLPRVSRLGTMAPDPYVPLSVPVFARASVTDELRADAGAWRLLIHRVIAQNPRDVVTPALVYAGIELMIRVLATENSQTGATIPRSRQLPIVLGMHPSPRLRLLNLLVEVRRMRRVGLVDAKALKKMRAVVRRAVSSTQT